MWKASKTFEMSYKDDSLRRDMSLNSVISQFKKFVEYYGSGFTHGYLEFFTEHSDGEKVYALTLTYPGVTEWDKWEFAPHIYIYKWPGSVGGIKGRYEINIPHRCKNAMAKNIIVFALMLAGCDCVTDTQRREAEEYMEFLNNSYTGKEPSDILTVYGHKILIYDSCRDSVVAVRKCSEIEGVGTNIDINEYEDYTGNQMLSECYVDKKVYVSGVVTAGNRRMPGRSGVDVSVGEKIYRVLYDYVRFSDYHDCLEIGKECNFYGSIIYRNQWREGDSRPEGSVMMKQYDGHLMLDYVTRR